MKQRIFFFTISLGLVLSCTSKKIVTEYKDKIVKDTIYTTKTIKEVERYTDTLTIESPCDSLGNLKPFKQVFSAKQGKVLIQGINNVIKADIDLKPYKDILEKEYKSRLKENTVIKEKEVIRYRAPLWLILLCPILYGVGYLTGKLL